MHLSEKNDSMGTLVVKIRLVNLGMFAVPYLTLMERSKSMSHMCIQLVGGQCWNVMSSNTNPSCMAGLKRFKSSICEMRIGNLKCDNAQVVLPEPAHPVMNTAFVDKISLGMKLTIQLSPVGGVNLGAKTVLRQLDICVL